MCGIVGLFLKNPKLQPKLGEMFEPMLCKMTSRGPDSAGFAIYRDPVKKGLVKLTLAHDELTFGWKALSTALNKALKCTGKIKVIANHAVLVVDAKEPAVVKWLQQQHPAVRVVNCIHWLVNAINSLTTFIRKVALTFRIINKSADVIIIDAEAIDSLVNCIPENVSYEVLPVRNIKELLKKFSISFFIYLFVVRMRSSKRSFNSVVLIALIKTYHPKVILTYIDNSSRFSNISSYLKKYKFLSVQNGLRWDLSRPDQQNLYFGNYYSFGLCEKDILNKGEHRFDSINPVGSIKLGIFLEQLKPQLGIERICVISQWISQLSFHDSKYDTDLDEIYTNAERDMFRLVDE